MSPSAPGNRPPRAAGMVREAPSGGRRGLPWIVVLIVLALSGTAGLFVASQFGPERLRREIEHQIGQATRSPCHLASLEVRWGLPIEFAGRGLSLWDGALEVEQLTARLSPVSALTGDVRFNRLEAEGVTLRLDGGGEAPSPPWLAPQGPPGPGGLESIADGVGRSLRRVLGGRLPADRMRVSDGRVDVRWRHPGGVRELSLQGLEAELQRSALLGTSGLEARGRLHSVAGDAGGVELSAERSRSGDLAATLAMDAFDLDLLAEWLPPDWQTASGRVSGTLAADAPEASEAVTLALDLQARDFRWLEGSGDALWSAPRAEVRAIAEALPDRVALRAATLASPPLEGELRGRFGRPLDASSVLDLDLRVADFDLAEADALLDALPAVSEEQARSVLESLEGGRVTSLALSGAGDAEQWRGALEGEADSLERPLRVSAGVEGLAVRLADGDRIEELGFRVSLRGDRLQIEKARGQRGGHPLPLLDLELAGLSALRDADFSQRVPPNDEVLLVGLPLLLSLFERDPGRPSDFEGPRVSVRLQRLEHPAMLWPVRAAEVTVEGREQGLVAEIRRATWAGIPLHGALDWSDEPAHLVVQLVAGAEGAAPALAQPRAAAPAAPSTRTDGSWAAGTFLIGRLESRVWSHERLAGRFQAVDSTLRFAGLSGDLLPSGRVRGRGEIDLGDADSLPYQMALVGEQLDAGALLAQAGLGEGLARGVVSLGGEISNRYERGAHPLAHLSGRLDVHARNGALRHDVPAVLALTLASDAFTIAQDREHVRYNVASASLEAEEGVVRTDALELDGPDVHLFGSGSLDLGHAPHALDADVVVFLFRPVDRALGSIPIVGDILLGAEDNLVAAYFGLSGPWSAPTATARPLRSLYTGPWRLVGKLPGALRRGLDSLAGVFREGRETDADPPPPEVAPDPGVPLVPTAPGAAR